jgi:hypothetical protein
MAVDSRVQVLLEELGDSGCTPEEVCAACPELLPEVRRRWLQICAVKADLHALFPSGSDAGLGADTPVPWHTGDELPQIPGYEVEALLGRGGMGLVYKARHLRLNRLVALKMLITGAYAGPHERARFQREAEAAASLRHAHIVQVHDVGDHEGWPYFTMEFLDGGSLSQALAGTQQPARQAAALVATLAEAMQVAHLGGIVHRDLKPANILLTADGKPKVADFGLARHFDGEPGFTLSGTRIGTPSYMAPEQVIGKAGTIGPAADIYALGVLLYEMLTGRPPFRGETAAETERQILNHEPVSPSRLNPKVPRDLETICLKCLSKEPQRRYASAAALAEDLTRFREGRPIQARPLGWGGRLWRWGRHKRGCGRRYWPFSPSRSAAGCGSGDKGPCGRGGRGRPSRRRWTKSQTCGGRAAGRRRRPFSRTPGAAWTRPARTICGGGWLGRKRTSIWRPRWSRSG